MGSVTYVSHVSGPRNGSPIPPAFDLGDPGGVLSRGSWCGDACEGGHDGDGDGGGGVVGDGGGGGG